MEDGQIRGNKEMIVLYWWRICMVSCEAYSPLGNNNLCVKSMSVGCGTVSTAVLRFYYLW